MKSAVPPPKPAAMMPEARPRRSLNHLSAEPIESAVDERGPDAARQYSAYSIGSEVA
jgi:hypothetical protein